MPREPAVPSSPMVRLLRWVDGDVSPTDPFAVARVRTQHLVVALCLLVAVPYVAVLAHGSDTIASLLALALSILTSCALVGLTRRGRAIVGGRVIASLFFCVVSAVLWIRGGLHSNSAIWMVLLPIIGGMVSTLRFGFYLAMASALWMAVLWGIHSAGITIGRPLKPESAWWLVLLDHTMVPLTVGLFLVAQGQVWSRVLERLRGARAQLLVEVEERKRAEEQALDSARARTTFLTTMSHEIRTPLNGILGVTDVLLTGELNADQRALTKVVARSGEELRNLLNDILDFSKIDSGQLELSERPAKLREVVSDLHDLWTPAASERGLELEVSVDAVVPHRLMLDKHRLKQILGNLLSNALKFTPSGTVLLNASTQGDRLVVTVRDTGIGIPADRLPYIFQPFRQVDESDARVHGGTGLGLTICRLLAERMGGVLTVTSTVGAGSTFTLSLPLVQASDEEGVTTTSSGFWSFPGRRVLVAEDNPVNQLVMRRLLEGVGVEVHIAADGEACVEAVQAFAPELVLMDCQMPVCDGYTATKRLRAGGSTVPIVAVTASAMAEDQARCLDAGMDAYLSKPVRRDELMRVLVEWLRRR